MQGWMIALIIVACVVAVLGIAFLVGSLIAVHLILGRRKLAEGVPDWYADYGIDAEWFDGVAELSSALEITAYDGVKLCATLYKHSAENSEKVAVCCHGYGTAPQAMQAQAKLFYDNGFDVLLPTMRGHGASGGRVGMAWLDRFDLLRWIDKITALYGESVAVAACGVSMGGATVVAAAGMNPPPQLKCVIDDCGFSSQYDEYSARLGKASALRALALLPLSAGVRLVHGYSIREADIVPLARQMSVPTLFIHGEQDRFVPIEQGRKLFDACASADKRFVAVPNAAHARAYAADPTAYSEAFTEFINKHVGADPEPNE